MPLIYKHFKIENVNCLAIYEYNDLIRSILLNIKGYYDKELAYSLLGPIQTFLRIKYTGNIVIPVPSTTSSDKKRGFNHVEEIVKPLGLKLIKCLYKQKNHKQSDQSKFNRSLISSVISIDSTYLNPNNHYLLVDDITTTGSTLKTCIKLLKSKGVKHISALIVALKK